MKPDMRFQSNFLGLLIFQLITSFIYVNHATSSKKNLVNDDCLNCICETMRSCHKTSCEAGSCGTYEITEAYWRDSGNPTVPGREQEGFLGCVSSKECAKRTIEDYMTKFQRDCDSDGEINCYDYASIHIQGPYACGGNYEFGPKIKECYDKALAEKVKNPKILPVDRTCLSCLCYATTKCNPEFQCQGDECGMFRINELYWREAGKPLLVGDNNDTSNAFKRCALDPHCAERAVTGYLAAYPKDCDGNGIIDCFDYMATHYLGANCVGTVESGFLSRFQNCRIRTSVISDHGET